MEKRLARLCWNDRGWTEPSGIAGKSKIKYTHEAKHGYGHEEWLFDISKTINGFHYGFLEPIRQHFDAYQNKSYEVTLYTINGLTKEHLLVGKIKRLEVLNKKEADNIKKKYGKNGWLSEMENLIKKIGKGRQGFSNWKGLDLFNVKYESINLELYDPCIQIPRDNPLYQQSRYSFTFFQKKFIMDNESDEFFFKFFTKRPKLANKISRYVRETKPVEINFLHQLICEGLTKKLSQKYEYENVTRELPAGYGKNEIDIVVKHGREYDFYEIKAYACLRTAIREAIGQLMEYSLWTNHKRATKLIIVTPPLIEIEKAITYLKHLRETFDLPIYYQHYNHEKDILSEIF